MIESIKKLFCFKKEEQSVMKYLIVGLGNMHADYDDTRHNIGFDVVDTIAEKFEVKFKSQTLGHVAECKHKGRTLVLLKPNTYMNLSGKSVRYWLQKKKIKDRNLMIVVDDMNLELGRLRLREKGSDGGHNGLKDINKILGSNVYPRLRVGIGNSFPKGKQVDFVLGKWTDEEMSKMPKILKNSCDAILGYATIGIERAMNQYNT